MKEFGRSPCLVVVAGGMTTRADISSAVESVEDIWHRNKVLVLLAEVPIVTKMLVRQSTGFRTVLLAANEYG